MAKLENLEAVVAEKRARMDRLADVMADDYRFQTPELHRAYRKVFLAWLYARQFLEIRLEEDCPAP